MLFKNKVYLGFNLERLVARTKRKTVDQIISYCDLKSNQKRTTIIINSSTPIVYGSCE